MMSDQANKMMDAADPKDGVTFKAVSSVTYEFFFPGSGKWQPMSVRAQSREEAQQYWEANHQPVNPIVAEATPEVTPEPKEEVEETKTNE